MYTFDEKKHIHTLDDKPLTGVTTVLGIVSKGDGLIQWSANEAIGYIKNNSKKELLPVLEGEPIAEGDYIVSEDTLNEAKTAWKTCRDTAGEAGTDVHGEIEVIIKDAIANSHINPDLGVGKNQQVNNFIEWSISNNIKFLESERNVYSKELWIGGIVDFVYEKDGEVYVGDIKTSKSIYPTNFWQTSAYQFCLQEMGLYPKIKGFTIVRLGRDGSFEVKENFAYEDNIDGFKSALNVYRKLNAITEPKFKRTKKIK